MEVACVIFYTNQASGMCPGTCACNHTHQMDLSFLVTLPDHVIKGSWDFIKGPSSLYIPHSAKFSDYKLCSREDMTLVCHAILQDQLVTWS